MDAIRFTNVSKALGGHTLFKKVNWSVSAGQCVLLTGPSGSGKTTLLRLISGFDVPDSGDIYVHDSLATRNTRLLADAHKREVAMVFQDLALWPHMSVARNITFGPVALGRDHNTVQRLLQTLLGVFNIEGLKDKYPHQLSGGEKQRVALARAMAVNRPLLLLDEPTASLDTELRQQFLEHLRRYRSQFHATVIFVTHQNYGMEGYFDNHLSIKNGGIHEVS